jgi:hypothetical protein
MQIELFLPSDVIAFFKTLASAVHLQLNRNGLNSGLYFLKLTLDDRWVETGKVVVTD